MFHTAAQISPSWWAQGAAAPVPAVLSFPLRPVCSTRSKLYVSEQLEMPFSGHFPWHRRAAMEHKRHFRKRNDSLQHLSVTGTDVWISKLHGKALFKRCAKSLIKTSISLQYRVTVASLQISKKLCHYPAEAEKIQFCNCSICIKQNNSN